MKTLTFYLFSFIFLITVILFLPKSAEAFSATCSPSPTSVALGAQVTWKVTVTNGQGPYNYTWSGSGGLTRFFSSPTSPTDSATIAYSTQGSHSASVTVFTQNPSPESKTITCSPNVTVGTGSGTGTGGGLNGTCAAYSSGGGGSPLSSISSGQTVAWKFVPAAGSTAPTSYNWSGSDNLSGYSSQITKTYYNTSNSPMIATAAVTVFAGGSSKNISCSSITVNGSGSTGGGGTGTNPTTAPTTNTSNSLNFRASVATTCVSGKRRVSLSWRALTGATKYSLTRDGPNIGDDLTGTTFSDRVGVSGNHTYVLFAHNSTGQIITQAQLVVNVPGCPVVAPTTVPFPNRTPTPPPGGNPAPTTNNSTTNRPTEFKVANAPSPEDCEAALEQASPLTFVANAGTDARTLSWNLSTGDASPDDLKTVCAQFKVNGIWLAPFYNQITLNSSGGNTNTTPPPSASGNATQPPSSGSSNPQATTQPTNNATSNPAGGTQNPTTAPTSASSTPKPTSTPNPPKVTVSYKLAESLPGLANAQWQPYVWTPLETTYTFADKNFGSKQLCVQFLADDGTISPAECKSLEYKEAPKITGCELKPADNNVVNFEISGKGFGSSNGKLTSGSTNLQISSWSSDKVIAKYLAPPVGQTFNLSLETSDRLTAPGVCSAISQLSLSARVFCPQVKAADIFDVELGLKNLDNPQGAPVIEKVTLTKEGLITGLKSRLVEGKKYQLSLKVPKGIKRSTEIMAEKGTTNIVFTTSDKNQLPLGDIFPLAGGDGIINTLDKTELNREWVTSVTKNDRNSDLNSDGRVNSFDWACMKQDFGASDAQLP